MRHIARTTPKEPRILAIFTSWHGQCNDPGVRRRRVRSPHAKGNITMSIRFELAQRAALSVVAALAFATIAISAAVPVLPIA